MEGSALLEAICDAPDDDDPRLVYADWLTQQGDPLGELIALQVRVARADADDVRLPERGRIVSRIRALLKAHHEAWTAPLVAIAKATYTFRRGFVEQIADYADRNFGFFAELLLAAAPLLRAANMKPSQLHPMIMNEASSRFEELVFEELRLDVHTLASLTERLEGGALRSVEFEAPFVTDRQAHQRLAEWPIAVEHFGVSMKAHYGVQVSATFLAMFSAAPHREALRSLRLERVNLERAERPATLFGVEMLELEACRMARQYGNLVKIVSALPSLASLAVSTDRISTDELEEVVDTCPTLRRVRLPRMNLETIDALLPWSAHLRRLDLTGNPLDDAAARAIAAAEWPHLIELRFPEHRLSETGKRALRDRFGDTVA